eukprot:754132-Hanusia_phi.AAC.1
MLPYHPNPGPLPSCRPAEDRPGPGARCIRRRGRITVTVGARTIPGQRHCCSNQHPIQKRVSK